MPVKADLRGVVVTVAHDPPNVMPNVLAQGRVAGLPAERPSGAEC